MEDIRGSAKYRIEQDWEVVVEGSHVLCSKKPPGKVVPTAGSNEHSKLRAKEREII